MNIRIGPYPGDPISVFHRCLCCSYVTFALLEAIGRLRKKTVQSLLAQHVDVKALRGMAPARSLAANWSDTELVDLLSHAGANVNAADDLAAQR